MKYSLIVSALTYVEERKGKFENSSTFLVLRLQLHSFLLLGILSAYTHYMAGVYPPQTFVEFADLVDTSDSNPLADEPDDIGDLPFLSAPTDLYSFSLDRAEAIADPADTSRSSNYIGTSNGILDIYFYQVGQYSMLSPGEELKLFKQIDNDSQQVEDYQASCQTSPSFVDLFSSLISHLQDKIAQTKERIVKANLRLSIYIAKKYQGRGLDLVDLIQEANIGLIRAVDKFDWQRGVRFGAYASWWIQQVIGLGLVNTGRTVRLPAHVVNTLQKINKAKHRLEQQGYQSPTADQIAEVVDLPLEKVQTLCQVSLASIDNSPTHVENNDTNRTCLVDQIADESTATPLQRLEQADLVQHLQQALETLPLRERQILQLRYGLNDDLTHSLQEVGDQFGISRERVRQIEKRALRRLQEHYPLQA